MELNMFVRTRKRVTRSPEIFEKLVFKCSKKHLLVIHYLSFIEILFVKMLFKRFLTHATRHYCRINEEANPADLKLE